jgi:hypothetical protein
MNRRCGVDGGDIGKRFQRKKMMMIGVMLGVMDGQIMEVGVNLGSRVREDLERPARAVDLESLEKEHKESLARVVDLESLEREHHVGLASWLKMNLSIMTQPES